MARWRRLSRCSTAPLRGSYLPQECHDNRFHLGEIAEPTPPIFSFAIVTSDTELYRVDLLDTDHWPLPVVVVALGRQAECIMRFKRKKRAHKVVLHQLLDQAQHWNERLSALHHISVEV